MKNNYLKLAMLFALLIGSNCMKSQCISSWQYPWGTNDIDATPGVTTTVAFCSFADEYSVNSFTVTGNYDITSTISTDFLTVTDANNNILIAGTSPLSVTIPSVGIYHIHVSSDPTCGTNGGCRDINVVVPFVSCSSVANSTVIASSPTVCGTTSVNLSLNANYNFAGITFQWYTSTTSSSGPWTAVSGGTLSTLSSSFSASSWIMAVITCTNGPVTTTAAAVQVSVVPGTSCECTAYCASSAISTADDEIFNVSIGTLNNTSSCGVTAPGPGSANSLYSNFAGSVPAPQLAGGVNYTLSVTVGQCGSFAYSGIVTAYIDYNQNGDFTDPGELVYTSPYTSFAVAGTTFTSNVTIPVSALTGITRMRVIAVESTSPQAPCGTYFYGETEDYCVEIIPPTPCSGTPGANTVIAGMPNVCPSGSVSLSLANSYTVGGLTYQWSVSSSSVGPWTAVSGATMTSFTATNLASSTWFQAVITCTNGNSSTTATPVYVTVNSNTCQCASYCSSEATSALYDEIFNVTIGTLNNTSNCSQTGGPGSIMNMYSNYAGILNAPTLAAGAAYPFSVTVGQCANFTNTGGVTVYMDFNQNGSFADPGEMVYASPSTLFQVAGTTLTANISIPASAQPGITRMRVIARQGTTNAPSCGTFFYGETEDYCIDIAPATPCSGTPAANTAITTNTSVCPAGSATLSLASSYTVGGLTYQWSTSTSSVGPFSAVTSATSPAYPANSISSTTWYQAVITCTNGGGSYTVAPVEVIVNNDPCACAAYCTSSATSQFDEELFNVSIGTLNNTSNCSQTGGPGSVMNRYSNYTGVVAAPSLTLGNTYTLSVTAGQCGSTAYSGIVHAYIDYNQNGSFTDPGENIFISPYGSIPVAGVTFTTPVTIPLSAVIGNTRMRVIVIESSSGTPCGTYSWGETEDYCVNLSAGQPCSGTPAANSAVASMTSVCPSGSVNITLASGYTVSGMAYQWSTSTSSVGPWTPVSGGTLSALTASNLSAGTWFQAVATCTNGNASTTVSPVFVNVINDPCKCASYCTSEATSSADEELFNVSIGTLNNTSSCSQTGGPGSLLNRYSNYTGIVAAPALTANSTYTLSVTAGQCGSFGYSGIVHAYIDYNQNGDFTDPGEAVFTSTYGVIPVSGITFTSPVTVPGTANLGTTRMRVIVVESNTGSPCGTYSWGETEDYCVNIVAPCNATVNVSASSGTVCNGGSTALTATGANTYTWSTGAQGSIIAVTPSVTTTYTVSGEAGGCVQTATVEIHVNALPGVTLTAAATTVCVNGPTIALSGSPAGGVYTGSNVVGSSFVPGGTAGTFMPVYAYSDSTTNCSNSASVSIIVSSCTDVNLKTGAFSTLAVYPNPSFGDLVVELANGFEKTITVTDVTGRPVLVQKSESEQTHLDISKLANGVYFVRIQSESKFEVVRIVKQ